MGVLENNINVPKNRSGNLNLVKGTPWFSMVRKREVTHKVIQNVTLTTIKLI